MQQSKNTNNNNTVNPSGSFRTSSKTSISVSGGNATATAGSGLKWVNGANNDDFQVVIVTGGSGSGNFANGKIVYQGTSGNCGDTVDHIAITGLTGVTY